MSNFSHQPSPMTFEYSATLLLFLIIIIIVATRKGTMLASFVVCRWWSPEFELSKNHPDFFSTFAPWAGNRKSDTYSGTVHFNGRPRDKLFPRISAYVPQEFGTCGVFFFSEKSTEDWWFAVVGGSISNNPFHIEVRIVNCQHWQKICGWLVAM